MTFHKQLILFFILLFPLSGFTQTLSYNPNHLYSIDELKSDFQVLRKKLEKKNPNLYLYTPKAEMDLFLDSLYNSIVKPSTELEFYNLITLLNAKIKDGHTMMLPGENAMDYFTKNGKFFPFFVFVNNNKLFVQLNCSPDAAIKPGTEIVSINGESSNTIINTLLSRQIRDGDNQTYPTWILNNYFKEYFSFSFGHPPAFSISYIENNAQPQIKTVDALTKDSIRYYKQARYSTIISSPDDKQGISVAINKELKMATLTIKSFDKQILKNQYQQNFRSTIDKIFAQIKSSEISSLILDLRNNQGGDFENGRLLLAYLITEQIKYLENTNESKIVTPKENNFKGDLYILINGGSFSNTGIVSSYLELQKRGIFIGEETGGNKTVLNGNAADIILPNTKIACQIATEKFVIRTSTNDGHGVIPVYFITPTINDIVAHKDAEKEFAISLIKRLWL
jgi:Peptidase family S41